MNPLPVVGPISGTDTVCVGDSIVLGNSVSGGAWAAILGYTSVSPTGIVIGITPGIDTISYAISTPTCGQAVAVLVVNILSVSDCNTEVHPVNNAESSVLKVYPNPSDGTFTLDLLSTLNEDVHVFLTNIVGQNVMAFTTSTNKAVEIKFGEARGIYFLSAITEHGQYVAKITIE